MTSATVPSCPHRPPCPGCPRFGAQSPPRSALDALREFAAEAGAPGPELVGGSLSGFRHRARLAVRGRLGSPKIGIFEEGSHRVVHIPNCVVHHPLINQVASVVRRALVSERIAPYSEQAHAGVARYLQVVIERASQTAQVVLVTNSDSAPLAAFFAAAARELGPRLHSLWHNPQRERTNTILGPTFERIDGPDSVQETLGGAAIFYPPGAFGQNNLELFERLVAHVHAAVPPGLRVAELYSGVGAIGLGLVERSQSVSFNELGAHSVAGLRRGIEALGPELGARTEVVAGPAADARELVRQADVVIADPPRKGLDREIVEALIAHRPQRFVYVSCGLASFLSQGRELLSGGFRLHELTAFDLFPFTEHVEVVASFG